MPSVKSNLACAALVVALQAQDARAQGDLLDTDGLAEAIVAMTSKVWTGPRTPVPEATPRPGDAVVTARSPLGLLAVHASRDVDPLVIRRTMRALEHARARLDAMGWPQPLSDGDRGGGAEWDLYLSGSMPPGARSDGLASWSYLDRASTYAVMSPITPRFFLACSMDRRPAPAWRY